MSENYNVYVSAGYLGPPRENKSLSTSNVSILLYVTSSYLSDVTISMGNCYRTWESFNNRSRTGPKEIKDSCTPKSFVFPCDSLLSDDGTRFISNIISEENVPFSLDKLQWRSSPIDSWISLGNRDDVIRQILDLVRCKASKLSTAVFHVIIKKEIVLPHHEYENKVNERRREEQERRITAAISFINRQPISSRIHYLRELRANPDYRPSESIEQAIRESSEEAAAGFKLTPASKSSVEALEEVIFNDKEPTCLCTICMENLVIGSKVTRMPCSHMFHKSCIMTWLERRHLCPVCRFELPTN